MRKQLSSSSSHRGNSPENMHAKSISCMSGVFQLVSKYHNRRKFLTFGKKQGSKQMVAAVVASATGRTQLESVVKPTSHYCYSPSSKLQEENMPKISFGVACRSPTLPAEIRLSNSVRTPTPRGSSALVARLMGLHQDDHHDVCHPLAAEAESAADKRRNLLGALEKCDEDLKALKKMIEEVKSSVSDGDEDDEILSNSLRPTTPVLLSTSTGIHAFTTTNSSATTAYNYSNPSTNKVTAGAGRKLLQAKKNAEAGEGGSSITNTNACFIHRFFRSKSSDEEDILATSPPSLRRSKAMMQSVNQVCRDIAWGETRETARIGMALQEHILRDIIQETVKEMPCCNSSCTTSHSLPFEACKRRLRF